MNWMWMTEGPRMLRAISTVLHYPHIWYRYASLHAWERLEVIHDWIKNVPVCCTYSSLCLVKELVNFDPFHHWGRPHYKLYIYGCV